MKTLIATGLSSLAFITVALLAMGWVCAAYDEH